jgi:DNA-binding GntR family transcriptional regulator
VVAKAFTDWLLYEALFRYPELLADSMLSTYKEHVAIVEALKKGDGDRAVQEAIAHVKESGKWLEEYLDIPADLLREKEEQVSPLMEKSKK